MAIDWRWCLIESDVGREWGYRKESSTTSREASHSQTKLPYGAGALTALEVGFVGLLALTPDQRQMLTKMGDKSEAFCRKADAVFGENLGILPANFDLPAYRRDLATMDALRPRLARLSKLSQRGDDTQMAVGSDLMTHALEGYAVLKVTGKGQGVDDLRKMLASRPWPAWR